MPKRGFFMPHSTLHPVRGKTGTGSPRSGSTILLALGFGIVLMIIIGGLRNYSSYRIASSIREWNNLKALSLAEAGLAMVVAEMSQNFNYATHEVDKYLKWGAPRTSITPSPVDFEGVRLTDIDGKFAGYLDDVEGSFEVRCGEIPYEDDDATKNVDESKAYIYVESIGNFKSTYRKITAVLSRRFPGKECLLYDGDVLSLVQGVKTNPSKANTYSKGNLYGHRGVEIAQILRDQCVQLPGDGGTRQALRGVPLLMSGKGGVFFETGTTIDDTDIPASPGWENPDFKSANFHYVDEMGQPTTYDKGFYPREFINAAPRIPDAALKYTRDKNNPIVMTPALLPKEYYKSLAGGETSGTPVQHSTYTGGTSDMVLFDWGDAIREGNTTANPSSKVIYCEKDVVVRGNPPGDVTIVSAGDVYVDGDFNQRKAHKYGYNQDYTGKNPFDMNTTDYTDLNSDESYKTYKDQYCSVARVIAGGRLVFDYSDPKLVFGNELYPFLEYKIAERIMDDEKATQNFLKTSGDRSVEKTESEEYTFTTTTTSSSESSNEEEMKEQAKKAAKEKLLAKVKVYLASDSSLPWEPLETELMAKMPDQNVTVDEVNSTSTSTTDSDGNTTTTTTTVKKVTVTFKAEPGWMEGFAKNSVWEKVTGASLATTVTALIDKCGSTDAKDDYLFFPEFTTVGTFYSFARRNPHDSYYPGADFGKHYDEMGTAAPGGQFIHRLYGTQTFFRTAKAGETGSGLLYNPPIRKKIYDETVVKAWDDKNILDVPTYGLMTWKESSANGFTF